MLFLSPSARQVVLSTAHPPKPFLKLLQYTSSLSPRKDSCSLLRARGHSRWMRGMRPTTKLSKYVAKHLLARWRRQWMKTASRRICRLSCSKPSETRSSALDAGRRRLEVTLTCIYYAHVTSIRQDSIRPATQASLAYDLRISPIVLVGTTSPDMVRYDALELSNRISPATGLMYDCKVAADDRLRLSRSGSLALRFRQRSMRGRGQSAMTTEDAQRTIEGGGRTQKSSIVNRGIAALISQRANW